MQSKITVSLNLQFWFVYFILLVYFFKVILCEIKGHCMELILYYGLMMDDELRVLRFSDEWTGEHQRLRQ